MQDYGNHWRAKHDPKKPKLDKILHGCGDCLYTTTHKSHMDKHTENGCPKKKKLEEKHEKEK